MHLYLVLLWNLIGRTNSVASLHLNAIDWREDALVVTFAKHKGDQEGANAEPKHVYANPSRPEICPVLALALNIFTCTRYPNNNLKLFKGSSIESSFSSWLRRQVKSGVITEDSIGICPKDLGSHSIRKGVSTYALSFAGGPSWPAVNLRAGYVIIILFIEYFLNLILSNF